MVQQRAAINTQKAEGQKQRSYRGLNLSGFAIMLPRIFPSSSYLETRRRWFSWDK